jgi:DNA-binding winged helix-turn-helix (wHTH) protein
MKEFDPFRLDTGNQCLWRRGDHGDEERILLKPKAFGILRYLVDHAGNLVTQEELLNAVWPNTYVQREVLKRHIVDIRNLLGDDPKSPAYIETRPWCGYQFIATVRDVASTAMTDPDLPARAKLVGRDQALADLRAYLGSALGGWRQIVFVTGEPGTGKTSLVDQFQREAASGMSMRIARGQCMEDYGDKEPWSPMLEALGNLCRGTGGTSVVRILAAQAPAWLAQFPSLVKPEEREMVPREILDAARQGMLREIGEALETIASEIPLLLVLEDVHLADTSMVDLISVLARGRRAAKLMVVATYRLSGLALSTHPLKIVERDLLDRRLCHELVLEPPGDLEMAGFPASESPDSSVPNGRLGLLDLHSEENLLFVFAALDHATDGGSRGMEKGDVRKEIEKLIRLRQNIDAAIADFERLDARLHAKGESPESNAGRQIQSLFEEKRKPRPVKP